MGYNSAMAKPAFGPSPALVRALTRLLRPLIRLLIARGVTFPYLMNLVKRLYVTTAEASLAEDATVSRLGSSRNPADASRYLLSLSVAPTSTTVRSPP